MSVFDDMRDKLLSYFDTNDKTLNSEFIQYHHEPEDPTRPPNCSEPCPECLFNDLRIFANDGTQPPVKEENHLQCHCYYEEVVQNQSAQYPLWATLHQMSTLKNMANSQTIT